MPRIAQHALQGHGPSGPVRRAPDRRTADGTHPLSLQVRIRAWSNSLEGGVGQILPSVDVLSGSATSPVPAARCIAQDRNGLAAAQSAPVQSAFLWKQARGRAKRQRGDSNPCGQSPMDFESISLTARTHCLCRGGEFVLILARWTQHPTPHPQSPGVACECACVALLWATSRGAAVLRPRRPGVHASMCLGSGEAGHLWARCLGLTLVRVRACCLLGARPWLGAAGRGVYGSGSQSQGVKVSKGRK